MINKNPLGPGVAENYIVKAKLLQSRLVSGRKSGEKGGSQMTENEQLKIEKLIKLMGQNFKKSMAPGVRRLTPPLTFKRQDGTPITIQSVGIEGDYAGQVHDGKEWLSADYIDGASFPN